MAVYPSIRTGRRRSRFRRWIYIIFALLIIAGVIAVILRYYPFGKSDEGTDIPLISTETGNNEAPVVFEPPKPMPRPKPEPNLVETAPALTAESDSKAGQLIAEAIDLINAKPARIIDARDRLNDALPMCASSQQRAFVKEKLSQLADKWLFSRTIFPQDRLCGSYKVKSGDQLRMIGKQFKVPYQILMEINNIPRPEALQAGKVIKVINGPFHAMVYRSTFTMDLYLQNTFVRSFPVGLGQPGLETPTGLWVVEPGRKLMKPRWTDPVTGRTFEPGDPDYPLGSRWIGLKGIEGNAKGRTGFAIHGTKDPNEIGTASSQGCIRLHNGDAILLYNLLVPTYSQVRVVD